MIYLVFIRDRVGGFYLIFCTFKAVDVILIKNETNQDFFANLE